MKQARALKPSWALGAIVVLGLIGLAGCTLIGDNVTGISAGAGPTTCIKQCNDFYKDQYKAEQKTHDTNVADCQTLPQPDKGNCLTAEDARHTAAMTALGNAKIECQNNCHRQGTGSAG